jgi:hypothetical protein
MAAEREVIDTGTLRDLIGSMKDLAESTRKERKISVAEASKATPWNPSGKPRTVKLKPPAVYQNGARLNPVMLSDEEVTLLNQLKPGVFNHKKWVVRKRRDKSLDIQYPNKTIEARMELKGEAGNLSGMLRKILTEYEAQQERKKRGEFIEDDDE